MELGGFQASLGGFSNLARNFKRGGLAVASEVVVISGLSSFRLAGYLWVFWVQLDGIAGLGSDLGSAWGPRRN